jgi:hypothetical protein
MKFRFRIWEIPTGKFYYQTDLDTLLKNPSVLPSKLFSGEDNLLKVQLSSGLLDKNGIEIYQGDIIRGYTANDNTEVISEILFSPHRGFYIHDPIEIYDRVVYDGGIYVGNTMEVVGNVFEHKIPLQKK